MMEVNPGDYKDTERVGQIINFLNRADISYFDRESDVLYQKQPFFISLILGYHFDLNREEHGEVIKVIYLIWEYFKTDKKTLTTRVTEEQFQRISLRNAHMLKYMEGAPGEKEKKEIISSDPGHLRSKALMTGVFFMFKTNKTLASMESEKSGLVLIGIKTQIECMEER